MNISTEGIVEKVVNLADLIRVQCPKIMRAGFLVVPQEADAKQGGAEAVTLRSGSLVLSVWTHMSEMGFEVGSVQFPGMCWGPLIFDRLFTVNSAPSIPTFESMDVWVGEWAPEIAEAFARRKWRTWWRLFWIRMRYE